MVRSTSTKSRRNPRHSKDRIEVVTKHRVVTGVQARGGEPALLFFVRRPGPSRRSTHPPAFILILAAAEGSLLPYAALCSVPRQSRGEAIQPRMFVPASGRVAAPPAASLARRSVCFSGPGRAATPSPEFSPRPYKAKAPQAASPTRPAAENSPQSQSTSCPRPARSHSACARTRSCRRPSRS